MLLFIQIPNQFNQLTGSNRSDCVNLFVGTSNCIKSISEGHRVFNQIWFLIQNSLNCIFVNPSFGCFLHINNTEYWMNLCNRKVYLSSIFKFRKVVLPRFTPFPFPKILTNRFTFLRIIILHKTNLTHPQVKNKSKKSFIGGNI